MLDMKNSSGIIINVRAFSSVGRASPLQGEGQKFESSNAHHYSERASMALFYYLRSVLYYECIASCESGKC